MKKVISILVLSALAFSACGRGEEPSTEPAEVVQQSMINLSDAKSGAYQLGLSGDLSGVEEISGSFEASAEGFYDSTERENPKFSISLDLQFDEEEKSFSASGELRMINKAIYAMLSSLDASEELPAATVEAYLNQWWKMPLPEDYAGAFQLYGGDDAEMSENEKELMELFRETQVFKNIEYVKNERVDGENAYRYSVELDKEALKGYFQEATKISTGEEMSEEELVEFAKMWDGIAFSGDVWVTEEAMTFKKLAGVVKITDTFGETVDIDLSYTVNNVGSEVEIVEPEDAFEFDPFATLGS